MIPKRIHHVWVGSDLPDAQRAHVATWRRTNPDFDLVLWNESNIDFSIPALRQAYRQKRWAKVADIARLKALKEQGGFYLDVDFVLHRSLAPLLDHRCVLGFQTEARTPDWVANGAMAAEPGHWFIALALERLLGMRPLPFGLDRPTRYGPKLITRLLIEQGLERYDAKGIHLKDIFLCPTESFFPWAYGEPFEARTVTPDSFGTHLWEKSWEKDVPAWIRTGQGIRRWMSKGAGALSRSVRGGSPPPLTRNKSG